MMRAAKGLHANEAGFNLGKEWQKLRASQRAVEDDLFAFSDTVNLETFLARSTPIVVTCMGWLLSYADIDTYSMAHCARFA